MQASQDLIKAAQYVRMSTEDQIYSTTNQMAAIGQYAALHQFEVVRTYADEGRSGVQIRGRLALQEMLRDILAGEAGYEAVLVFDVSRWGRFQDADESAHYEFLCRQSGVQIHYCAESFRNDGSLASAIMKNVRRIMAGEFSRDLSEKTWAGQSRLASLGYKMGGKAGYGLRRLLVDRNGEPKQILEEGDHKSIATDRIILVPGPIEEVVVVQRIFRLAHEGLNYQAIANELNADHIASPVAAKWCNGSIRAIVRAERYIGENVYNKRSMKLGSRFTYNPENEWIRCDHAFEPLVTVETFKAIQGQRRYGRPSYTDQQLLTHLKELFTENGYLSKELISSASPPSAKTYNHRFGNLRNAYGRVGYDPSTRDRLSPPCSSIDEFIAEVRQSLEQLGHRVSLARTSRLLTIDGRTVLAPRLYAVHPDGFWRLKFTPTPDVDLVLAGILKDGERTQMFVLPMKKFNKSRTIRFKGDRDGLAIFKLWDFAYLPEMIHWLVR